MKRRNKIYGAERKEQSMFSKVLMRFTFSDKLLLSGKWKACFTYSLTNKPQKAFLIFSHLLEVCECKRSSGGLSTKRFCEASYKKKKEKLWKKKKKLKFKNKKSLKNFCVWVTFLNVLSSISWCYNFLKYTAFAEEFDLQRVIRQVWFS